VSGCGDVGIIAVAPNDWRGQWVNRQQLLSRLGVRWPIVYSNGTWMSWDRGSDEWRHAHWRGAFTRDNGVWLDEPPRGLLRWPRVPALDRVAIEVQALRWRRQLARAGAKRRIGYVCHPAFVPYVDAMSADWIVYHAYDLFDHQPGWTDVLDSAERALLRRADLVLAPSQALADELMRRADRSVEVLLNAADVPRFLAAARSRLAPPPDLAAIPAPRVGYLGSLHPQIDWALIRTLAASRPSYQWVLIGPRQRERDLLANPDFVDLSRLPNVHLLGGKDHDAIADYTVHMDVNVMIYRSGDDSWTKVAYPLKLHEYLASGRPIVSMELPMLRSLSNVIRFARDPQDWLAALDDAIVRGGVGTETSRQAAAAAHSWDARVAQLESRLETMVSGAALSRNSPSVASTPH
jgi:glycosyltransferase involved in cell wall biosynthesis